MRRVWQLKRIFVALGVSLAIALVVIGASAATQGQQQQQQNQNQVQQGNYAVVGLQESSSSGYHGLAVLRGSSSGDQTEVVVGIMSTGSNSGGGFNFFGSSNGSSSSDVGSAAIHSGTCSNPGSEVASIGQLQLLPSSVQSSASSATPSASATPSGGSSSTATPSGSSLASNVQVYVRYGTVPMSLNSLLSGHYIIVVTKGGSSSGTAGSTSVPTTPSAGTAMPSGTATSSGGLLVCGQLSSTSSISSGTATGTPMATGTP